MKSHAFNRLGGLAVLFGLSAVLAGFLHEPAKEMPAESVRTITRTGSDGTTLTVTLRAVTGLKASELARVAGSIPPRPPGRMPVLTKAAAGKAIGACHITFDQDRGQFRFDERGVFHFDARFYYESCSDRANYSIVGSSAIDWMGAATSQYPFLFLPEFGSWCVAPTIPSPPVNYSGSGLGLDCKYRSPGSIPKYISSVIWPNVSGGVGGEWIYFKVAGITHWQAFNLDGIHLRAYGKRIRLMMNEINTPAGGAQVFFQNLDGTWWGFSSSIPLGPDFNFDPNIYGPWGLGPFRTMLIASVEGAKAPPAVDDVYLNPVGIGL